MKDYSGMNIFELMEVPTKELKALTMEEFAKEINNKSNVNIHPFTDNYCIKPSGDICIEGVNAHIYINEYEDGYKMHIWGTTGRYSSLNIHLSENIVFGIYSYGNGKIYRIAFEGNNHDWLISAWNENQDKKQIIQDDIRDLVRKYEYQKRYCKNNSEILADVIEKLKKIIDELCCERNGEINI